MTTSAGSLALLVLSWVPATASLASAQASAPQAGALEIGDPYFPGLGNGGYDVEHHALELLVDMGADEIAATASIRARALQALASFSLDLIRTRSHGRARGRRRCALRAHAARAAGGRHERQVLRDPPGEAARERSGVHDRGRVPRFPDAMTGWGVSR
jgi:hypothetical protein